MKTNPKNSSPGELTLLKSTNHLDEQIAALERLNDNVYKRKYDDVRVSKLKPASLFTNEQIKQALSSTYLQENEEMQKMSNRIKSAISKQRYSDSRLSQSNQEIQRMQRAAKKQ